jgi:hypothetical protein
LICLVQWRISFFNESIGLMIMRLSRQQRCGSDRPQRTFTNNNLCYQVGKSGRKRWRLCTKLVLVNKVCDYSHTKCQCLPIIFGKIKKMWGKALSEFRSNLELDIHIFLSTSNTYHIQNTMKQQSYQPLSM